MSPELTLQQIRRAWHWTNAKAASGRGDIPKALKGVRKIEAIGILRPFEKAFKAGLLLRAGDYLAAERLFLEVINSTEGDPDEDLGYVNIYSKFILSDMRGDLVAQARLRRDIAKKNCRKALKRWLPI